MNTDVLDLKQIKENILNIFSNELSSNDMYDSTYIKSKITEIKDKINNNNLIFDPTKQVDATDSNIMNQNNESLYIDLLTTFQCINEIDEAIERHISLNQSTIKSINTQVQAASDTIEALENTIGQKNNPIHVINSFNSLKNIETDKKYYKERYGNYLPENVYAYYDSNMQAVTLPKIIEKNQCIDENGTSYADINILKQIGKGFISIKNFDTSIEKAIDSSEQTFWQETILADDPLRVSFGSNAPTTPQEATQYYYGTSFGAMVEIELKFEYNIPVNEIYLNPYCKYPLEIIAIRYKETSDNNEMLKEIVSPSKTDKSFKNVYTNKPISFKFETVQCKTLRILFRQIHYTRNVINYSVDDVFKNELWYNIISQNQIKPLKKDDILFKPLYNDKYLNNNVYQFLNNTINLNKKLDIGSILFDTKTRRRNAIKYEYIYGFYNIACIYNNYNYSGTYVFNRIDNLTNIRGMSITTQETHPLAPDGETYTDIEYYITYKDNPIYEDWFPILPKNVSEVKCELLQIQNNKCYLRFAAATIKTILIDNNKYKPLIEGYDYFIHKNIDEYIEYIEIPNFDFVAKYTIDYIPSPKAYYLNFTDIENNVVSNNESPITCDGKGYYKLSAPVYLNPLSSAAQSTLIVFNNKTGETHNQLNGDIQCITNNSSPSDSYKNFTKTDKIQYYISENYIYFNQELDSNHVLELIYNCSVSSVRLKTILRKNNDKYIHLTPTLTKIDYELYPMA